MVEKPVQACKKELRNHLENAKNERTSWAPKKNQERIKMLQKTNKKRPNLTSHEHLAFFIVTKMLR